MPYVNPDPTCSEIGDLVEHTLYDRRVSIPEAAARLAALVSKHKNLFVPLSEMYFHCLVWNDGRKHERTVELLATLSRQPPARASDGEQRHFYHMRLWEDLPFLGFELREDWNFVGKIEDRAHRVKQGRALESTAAEWRSFQEFHARCVATGIAALNFNIYCIWCMREALEEPHELHPAGARILRMLVPGAAEWIFHAGQQIFQDNTNFEQYMVEDEGPGYGGRLWNTEGGAHKQGFCAGRWGLWRERFGSIACAIETVDKQTRNTAWKAYETMRVIESKHQGLS